MSYRPAREISVYANTQPTAWKIFFAQRPGRPDVRVPLSQRIEAREALADLMRNYGAANFTLMNKASKFWQKSFSLST
jgi:hypothetical protein